MQAYLYTLTACIIFNSKFGYFMYLQTYTCRHVYHKLKCKVATTYMYYKLINNNIALI